MAAEKSRKNDKNQEGNFLTAIRTYIKEVRTEMNKVTWPDRDEVIQMTRLVLLVTILSSLFLGAVSFLLTLGMEYAINDAAWALVVVFIGIVVGAWYWIFGRNRNSSNY